MAKESTSAKGANIDERPRRRPRAYFHTGSKVKTTRWVTRSKALLPPGTTTVPNTSLSVSAATITPMMKSRMSSATRRTTANVGRSAGGEGQLDLPGTAL